MKYFNKIIIFLILIFSFCNVYCKEVEVFERNESNNFGNNKDTKITNPEYFKDIPYVDASKKIYDFSDILSDEEEDKLYMAFNNYIEKYNIDLVFVSNDIEFSNYSMNDDYAEEFYDFNDFGINYDDYSGILIFRNSNIYKPYYTISLTGKSRIQYTNYLEDALDLIEPYFTHGNYYNGLSKLVEFLDDKYDENAYNYIYIDDNGLLKYGFKPNYVVYSLIALVFTFIIISIMVSKNKMVKFASDADAYLDEKSIKYTSRSNTFVSSHTTSHVIESNSGGSSGSFGGHIGSSGIGHNTSGRRG